VIDVTFLRNSITIDGKKYNLSFPIKEAFALEDKVIVLFDPDSYIPKFGQFQNLIALDVHGNEIWKAELPTNESSDCYYMVTEVKPLKASSFKSYECQIDPSTGKIVHMVFYK
jgi:hypothetical protein